VTERSTINGFGLVVNIVVLVAIAVAILVFERSRAKQIEDDPRAGPKRHGIGSDEPER
jgi:hypothetical protein